MTRGHNNELRNENNNVQKTGRKTFGHAVQECVIRVCDEVSKSGGGDGSGSGGGGCVMRRLSVCVIVLVVATSREYVLRANHRC